MRPKKLVMMVDMGPNCWKSTRHHHSPAETGCLCSLVLALWSCAVVCRGVWHQRRHWWWPVRLVWAQASGRPNQRGANLSPWKTCHLSSCSRQCLSWRW